METEKCELCDGKMVEKETQEVAGTRYRILKCEKCKHQVARSE